MIQTLSTSLTFNLKKLIQFPFFKAIIFRFQCALREVHDYLNFLLTVDNFVFRKLSLETAELLFFSSVTHCIQGICSSDAKKHEKQTIQISGALSSCWPMKISPKHWSRCAFSHAFYAKYSECCLKCGFIISWPNDAASENSDDRQSSLHFPVFQSQLWGPYSWSLWKRFLLSFLLFQWVCLAEFVL